MEVCNVIIVVVGKLGENDVSRDRSSFGCNDMMYVGKTPTMLPNPNLVWWIRQTHNRLGSYRRGMVWCSFSSKGNKDGLLLELLITKIGIPMIPDK